MYIRVLLKNPWLSIQQVDYAIIPGGGVGCFTHTEQLIEEIPDEDQWSCQMLTFIVTRYKSSQ